ncbi:MAG: DegT/DnrJ/EryC1/StrS family aminotransferase [Methylococcales bacterium]|nr:DegT/DnrJ/EryC1/StrS family aminotransferase [Methylococcales bacterium]
MASDPKIYVTQPLLPPLEDLTPLLQQIWDNKRLTNAGPFHQQFEQRLGDYLGVKHVSLFTNGTLALVTALQALRITGEVITTPYTFVATCHALNWNDITPVFVDIEPGTFNLNPAKIEQAITPDTSAILPVHCYGTPCRVEQIQDIADIFGLKVIYDAAHAFAVRHRGQSVLNVGDLSILSFHATKVFNTFEGGAIISPDTKTKKRIDYLKNFGFADEVTVMAPGINGKMSEFNAALGLLQLDHIDRALAERRVIADHYRQALSAVNGITPGLEHSDNYGYFPILVGPDYPLSRDQLCAHLRAHGVIARKYFYPLVSSFPMYRHLASARGENLPNAQAMADQVLCLPIYPGLEHSTQVNIIQLLASPFS